MSPAPQAIVELVERFRHNHDYYHRPDYNESQVRSEFIDPFFEALGWDIGNRAGASWIVMEPKERALSRGAKIAAYISGFGTTCDGENRINPSPDGKQLARAIKMALADAGVAAGEINYISLDGLAVGIWDDSEVKAVREVFGDKAKKIPASCPKSMFGNLLGASGAVDLITTILAMENNLVPPTINLDQPYSPYLDYVAKEARPHQINKALIISRGRGGINSALVIEKGS